MDASFYLSAGALTISLGSFAWSIHIGRRDRGRLKAVSKLYVSDSGMIYLQVKAVNHGRRPVILAMIGSTFPDGSWQGTNLETGSTRLDEAGSYEKTIIPYDNYTISREGQEAIDLWFKDTLGRRYKVKYAKKHLIKLFGR